MLSYHEEIAQFINLDAQDSYAAIWPNLFLEYFSENYHELANFSSGIEVPDFPNSCGIPPLTMGTIASSSANNEHFNIVAQSYGPAQAFIQFEEWRQSLSRCVTTNEYTRGLARIVTYNGGFLLSMGDVIVQVSFNSTFNRNEYAINQLIETVANAVSSTLSQTNCTLNLVSASDTPRVPFFNLAQYTGLWATINVVPTENTDALQIQVENTYDSLPEILSLEELPEVPEGPFPEYFIYDLSELYGPESLIIPPVVDEKPDYDYFVADDVVAEFQIIDQTGPGCGWGWSGFSVPRHNGEALHALQLNTIETAQIALDDTVEEWMQVASAWLRHVENVLPNIAMWNEHVESFNEIFYQWTWLNEQRALLLPSWNIYIDQLRDWFNFPHAQASAHEYYMAALNFCEANPPIITPEPPIVDPDEPDESETDENEANGNGSDNNGNDIDSFTLNLLPPMPFQFSERCLNSVPRPSILDQEWGEMPQPIEPPEGVTIPYSWWQRANDLHNYFNNH